MFVYLFIYSFSHFFSHLLISKLNTIIFYFFSDVQRRRLLQETLLKKNQEKIIALKLQEKLLRSTPHTETEMIIDENVSFNSVEMAEGELKKIKTADSISENSFTEIAIVDDETKMIVENEVVNEVVNDVEEEIQESAEEEVMLGKEVVQITIKEKKELTEVEKEVVKEVKPVAHEDIFIDAVNEVVIETIEIIIVKICTLKKTEIEILSEITEKREETIVEKNTAVEEGKDEKEVKEVEKCQEEKGDGREKEKKTEEEICSEKVEKEEKQEEEEKEKMAVDQESVICALPLFITAPLSFETLPPPLLLSTTPPVSHSSPSVSSPSLPSYLPLSFSPSTLIAVLPLSPSTSTENVSLPSSLPLFSLLSSLPLSPTQLSTTLSASSPVSLPLSLPQSLTNDEVLTFLDSKSDPSSCIMMDIAADINAENFILENNNSNTNNDNNNSDNNNNDNTDNHNNDNTDSNNNNSNNESNNDNDKNNDGETEIKANCLEIVSESEIVNVDNAKSADPRSGELLSLLKKKEKTEEKPENREINAFEKTEMRIQNITDEKMEITIIEEKPFLTVSCLGAVHTLQVEEKTEMLISAKEVESSVPLFSIQLPTEDTALPLCNQSTTLTTVSYTEKINPYSGFCIEKNSPNGYRTPRYVRTTKENKTIIDYDHHALVLCCILFYIMSNLNIYVQ